MPQSAHPAYRVHGEPVSLADLLSVASEPEYRRDNFNRLSDFHLAVGSVVRMRVDGQLHELEGGEPLTEPSLRNLLAPHLPPEVAARLEDPAFEAADFAFGAGNARFRANLFRTFRGLCAAIRILPSPVPDPFTLGFPDRQLVDRLLALKNGLVLFTGATGSGKSTTIAALVQRILDRQPRRIITLEDPIEFVYEDRAGLVSQRELGTHIKSFADGLSHALREDPDVIVVGEIRDEDTARLALRASETGHLVLATLHTRDVIGTLPRMLELVPASAQATLGGQLALSLRYVIGHEQIVSQGGYRIALMEVLRNSAAISNHIRNAKWDQIQTVMQTGGKEGMWTRAASLKKLVEAGLVDPEQAAQL